MRKRIVAILTTGLILISAGVAAFSVERTIVPDMNFVGEVIELTLDDAVEIMQTKGSKAEAAALNKAADEAIAKGYKESAQSMADYFRSLDKLKDMDIQIPMSVSIEAEAAGMTDINEKVIKIRRDFAKEQLDANYEAELNEIEAMTIQVYYGVLLAEENLKVTKENLSNQKSIFDNTMKKYKLGSVAKVDTLTAETQVTIAEDQVATAETAVKNAKMNLNLLLGYDLMQAVRLTDSLKMIKEPEGNLTGFIEKALKNRNEIKGVNLAADIQKILLTSLKYRYPTNSATYLKQESATLQAEKSAKDAPVYIEMDIRSQYMDIADKKRGITVAQANLNNAKEGYRLATISFNAGMNTTADVQQAQIASFQAALGLAAAINEYDLAVYGFEHAIGAGTTRLPL